jgi:hypothetical protein
VWHVSAPYAPPKHGPLYLQVDEFDDDDFLEEPMEVGSLFLFHLKPAMILAHALTL